MPTGHNYRMRVAVFGHRGWIGGQLIQHLQEAGLTVLRPDVRADDADAVREYLAEARPDRVVSVLGRTHGPGCGTIDYLEDAEGEHDKLRLNLRDNLFAPMTLALACVFQGVHFSYLGTGCIFEGDDGFTEDDDPNFFGSAYSVVKGYTDRLFRQPALPVLNARIRMPISSDDSPRNFIRKIASYERVVSVSNSVSVLPTLLPPFVQMIRDGYVGTVNLVNPGSISHAEVLDMYRQIVDPAFTYTLAASVPLKARRSNNRLDTSTLQMLFPSVPDVRAAAERCLHDMKPL